jgi:hypothetical protein
MDVVRQPDIVMVFQFPEGSILHKILFMDFHLSWFFYLPSQVLIALQAGQKGRTA